MKLNLEPDVLFENEPECVKLLTADGALLKMNPAGLRMLEAESLNQIENQCVHSLVAEEHRAAFRELTQKVFRGDSGTLEFQIVGLKGRRRWLKIHASPLRDATGAITALLGFSTDVTVRKQTEEKLRESEERLRLALDAARMGQWDWNILTGEVVWSRRCMALYSLPPDSSMSYERFLLTLHPDDRERIDAALRRAVKDRTNYDEQKRIVWPDGSVHWAASRGQVYCDAAGQPVRMAGVSFDITERKQVEVLLDGQKRVLELVAAGAPLPESLTALVRLIEAHAPGMLGSILLLDEEGVHLHHGAAPSLPPEYVAAIDGVSIGPKVGSYGAAAYCKEAVFVEDIATDLLWNEYKALALAHGLRACWSTPIFDAQRQVLGTFAMYYRQPALPQPDHRQLIDMATHTAAIAIGRHRIEAALRESQARLELANRATRIGPWDWDLLTNEVHFSAEWKRQLGHEEHEIGNRYEEWESRLHPDDRDRVLSVLRAYHAGERPDYEVEFRLRHKGGSYRWIFTRGEVLRNTEGKPYRMFGCHLDITERKRAQEALTLFRTLIDHANDSIEVIDPETGRFLDVNEKACQAHGYTREEYLALTVPQINARIAAEPRKEIIEELRRSGSRVIESQHRRKDGSVFPVEVNVAYIRLDRDYLVAVVRDITERKRAEEALRASVARMTRQESALIALARKGALPDGELVTALRRITEVSARTLNVQRVSVWRFNQDRTGIRCVDLYELQENRHSAGMALAVAGFPAYFQALAECDVIVADDAHEELRTRELSAQYLMPWGISSMMDGPTQLKGVLDGVVCLEHVGPKRHWTSDERTFAIAVANAVSLALEEAERRQAEQALRDSEERFRELAETIQEVFWITDPAKNRMLYVSPAYETIWGRSCQSLYDAPRSWLDAIHPDDVERVLRAATTRQIEGTYDEEYRIIRPDGQLRWIRDRAFPVRDSSGQMERVVGVARDITERKSAEEDLHSREEHFRLLIENASDLITVINHHGVIGYQSPAAQRVLGYTPEEVIGRSAFDFVHPDDATAMSAAIQRALTNTDAPVSVEYRFRHQNGQWRTLQSIGRNIPGQAKDGFIVVNSRDITERRQLEEQLRQSQKMEAIGQLAGGVAHDFNNILAAMLLQTGLTGMVEHLPEEVRDGLREIRTAAERAADLTRQLLLFSRRQLMQPRDLDLNEAVTNLVKMLQRIIGEDVRLQLDLHPAPLGTCADAGMLDQVLMNLAVNARDAMPQGGRLVIATAEKTVREVRARLHPDATPGRYVCLSVSDTGTGIPTEVLPRIFEPFFTTKEQGKGTGLGLATVFGIVKQHEGWIQVESEPGRGTKFQIFLPARAASATEPAQAEAQLRPRGGTETILLAEDEPAVRSLTREVLERHGYCVLEAANGVEALEIWRVCFRSVALLLTDLVMPAGVSGQQLARRLQADQPSLKVIYFSGYSAEIGGRELQLRGGEHFVQKPFAPHQLLETVRRCLDG